MGLVAAAVAVAVITVGAGVAAAVGAQWSPTTATMVAANEIDLEAKDAESATLRFSDGSQATARRSVSDGRAVLQTEDMVEPPSDRALQVWLMDKDGNATSAALMTEAGDRTCYWGAMPATWSRSTSPSNHGPDLRRRPRSRSRRWSSTTTPHDRALLGTWGVYEALPSSLSNRLMPLVPATRPRRKSEGH